MALEQETSVSVNALCMYCIQALHSLPMIKYVRSSAIILLLMYAIATSLRFLFEGQNKNVLYTGNLKLS